MKLVVIESPYAGDIERNLGYLRQCLRNALLRGEAPFASHALYTQPDVLDDLIPAERAAGMEAGWQVMKRADLVAVYCDIGLSIGMADGMRRAGSAGIPIVFRTLRVPAEDFSSYNAAVAFAG